MSITKFSGFKTYKAPTYTVTCPQSGFQYEVRSLNVGEVTRIRESLITPNRLTETILDVMWAAIDKDSLPANITTKELFEQFTTTNDRTAIIYGIYYITFGNSKEYELKCGYCASSMTAKIDYSEFVHVLPYPGSENIIESYKVAKTDTKEVDDVIEAIIEENTVNDILSKFKGVVPIKGQPESIARSDGMYKDFFDFIEVEQENIKLSYENIIGLFEEISAAKKTKTPKKKKNDEANNIVNLNTIFNKKVEVKLPESGVYAIIKAPTIYNERILNNKLIMNNEEQLSIASDILFIDRFEEYSEDSKSPIQVVSDLTDILEAYYSLPLEDRKELISRYNEEFGQYNLELNIKWTCSSLYCKETNELEVDIIDQFFRASQRSK